MTKGGLVSLMTFYKKVYGSEPVDELVQVSEGQWTVTITVPAVFP